MVCSQRSRIVIRLGGNKMPKNVWRIYKKNQKPYYTISKNKPKIKGAKIVKFRKKTLK